MVAAPASAAPAESALDLSAQTGQATYRAGDTVTITVRNTGTAEATTLRLFLTNDLGSTYTVGGGTGWNCFPLPDLACFRPTLGAGETTTLAISGVAKRLGSFQSAVKVTHGVDGTGPVTGDTAVAFSVVHRPGWGGITGHVYDDLNGNGRYDPGVDRGVPMDMWLLLPDNTLVTQMRTDGDGSYRFGDFAPGPYQLSGFRVVLKPSLCPGCGFVRNIRIIADRTIVLDVIAPPYGPSASPSAPPAPPPAPAPTPGLPITGARVGLIAGAGTALVMAGVLLLALARRRRSVTPG
jgi:hypothetical protein